jgi:UDP-glucose/GDP-mannose dehydrogenase family, UDP binding domain/UDP-glucose/GDP-mannose dehydrogenase family, central domain
MAFLPGPGVGGHCIPVDPSYLSHRVKAQLGYSFRMVELAEEINTAAPLYVATRLRDLLNDRSRPVKGSRVLLLGVTYKANISDCRESPADPLAKQLLAWGADMAYHDPYVPTWHPPASTRRWTRCPTSSRPCATPMSWYSCRPTPNMRSPSSPTRQRCCSTHAESSPGTPPSRCSEGWSGSDDLVDDGTRHVDRLEVPDHPIAACLSQPLAQRGIAGE